MAAGERGSAGDEGSSAGYSTEASARRPTCVLVADDEPPMRLLYRVNLELGGMTVLEASDGPAALAIAFADRPDVILLDGMLPGLDGWAVAAALLADSRKREIPIIFLSVHAELAHQARAIELGAVAYVAKPFNPVKLPELIESVIAGFGRGRRDARRTDELARITERPRKA